MVMFLFGGFFVWVLVFSFWRVWAYWALFWSFFFFVPSSSYCERLLVFFHFLFLWSGLIFWAFVLCCGFLACVVVGWVCGGLFCLIVGMFFFVLCRSSLGNVLIADHIWIVWVFIVSHYQSCLAIVMGFVYVGGLDSFLLFSDQLLF